MLGKCVYWGEGVGEGISTSEIREWIVELELS